MIKSNVEAIKIKADTYNLLPGMNAPDRKVWTILNALYQDLDKDLVVFFDEADLLTGPGLLTFLAQIRDGYNSRHKPGNNFPSSLALVGMRDIRDYIASEHPQFSYEHLASPFNIKKKALTLPNFTQTQISDLFLQHTKATGQIFEKSAIAKAWYWSEGQPWLVNALVDIVIVDELKNDLSARVTSESIEKAAEILIKRRDTHIDSLLERLKESRVKKIMESILTGTLAEVSPDNDESRYCQDLGLLTISVDKLLRPSNPIYKEVIIKTLTDQVDKFIPITPKKKLDRWTTSFFK
jgi:hypothetical protein